MKKIVLMIIAIFFLFGCISESTNTEPITKLTCDDIVCNDNDPCTDDSCIIEEGKPVCKYTPGLECPNNGICEPNEISTCDPFSSDAGFEDTWAIGPEVCCPGRGNPMTEKTVESDDCPETCDDGNPLTGDYYDFEAQECKHIFCE